jgi:hypothetical protein
MHPRGHAAVLLLLAGCRSGAHTSAHAGGGDSGHGPASESSGRDPTSSEGGSGGDASSGGDHPESHFDLPAPRTINDGNFATSSVCSECHANADTADAMRTAAGDPIAPYDLWQGTMMANAARDPVWWAAVRAEVAATPSRQLEIEAECTRCHAPMAAIRNDLYAGVGMSLAGLVADDDRGQLGLDGVACASCHQIGTGNLGAEASYSGRPELTTVGRMYGPHADPFTMPMEHRAGFTPTLAPHMDESAVCSSCHTLDTDALTADGEPTGAHYSEQATYLEWRNSSYSTEGAAPSAGARSCQSCHMPSLDDNGQPIATRIAHNPMGSDFGQIGARSPYHEHAFVGGNTWAPQLLRDHADELRPRGTTAAFDATIAWARDQLANVTATVAIDGPSRSGERLEIPVVVTNAVGHKFPSGYPARRAWLRVIVRAADDSVVFRSGEVDDDGRLLDGDGQVLASEQLGGAFEPHHVRIDEDDDVQIYEEIMADAAGQATFRLLRADHDAKDNRLLPAGWIANGPDQARIAAVLGRDDPDFVGGADRLRYELDAPAAAGPYTVEVTLLYQPLSARHLAEILAYDADEIDALAGMLAGLDRRGEVVASATAVLP